MRALLRLAALATAAASAVMMLCTPAGAAGGGFAPRPGQTGPPHIFSFRPIAGIPHAGTMVLDAGPDTLLGWPADYNGGNCNGTDYTPGTYTTANMNDPLNGSVNMFLMGISGQVSNCAHRVSPDYYQYGVFEVRFHVSGDNGNIPDWPAIWMTSIDNPADTWGTMGYTEVDAFEGNSGLDYTSYWSGATPQVNPYGNVIGYSTSGTWTSGGTDAASFTSTGIPCYPGPVAAPCAGIGPGWHTVDWVWGPGFIDVYHSSALYTEIPTITSNPMQIALDDTEGPNGYQPGVPSALDVEYVKAWTYES